MQLKTVTYWPTLQISHTSDQLVYRVTSLLLQTQHTYCWAGVDYPSEVKFQSRKDIMLQCSDGLIQHYALPVLSSSQTKSQRSPLTL